MGNAFARRQEILRILLGNQSCHISAQHIFNALPEHLRVRSLKTIRRDLTTICDDSPLIDFKQGKNGGVKYMYGKYGRIFSLEQQRTLEKLIERANAENDTNTAQILQGLIEAYA